jgi:hypothetical protein
MILRSEILQASKRISTNKALAWDCIPDQILKTDLTDTSFWDGITRVLNWALKDNTNFNQLSSPRLIIFNKNKDSTPTIDNLRPIIASGPLRKLAEALILPELQNLASRSDASGTEQTGFKRHLGTGINLIKLISHLIEA